MHVALLHNTHKNYTKNALNYVSRINQISQL